MDAGELEHFKVLQRNYLTLLVKVANEVKDSCNREKKVLGTIDETLMNFVKQQGMIEGIDLLIETIENYGRE